jgi:hypothetical protein
VQHLLLVRVGDRVGDRDHVLEQTQPLPEVLRLVDLRLEALAVDQLHAVVRLARALPPEVVQRHDARVLQPRRDRRLEREPLLRDAGCRAAAAP